MEEEKETIEEQLTEEEQMALEMQKQEEIEAWITNRRQELGENGEETGKEENEENLFWSDSD